MIITTEWLSDYLSPRVPLADLLAALPRVGLDVEATHVLARDLAPVRIGFIRSMKPLDGSTDKFVCGIEVAKGDLRQIVCASAHPVDPGWGVPVALAGTELPTGVSIREEHFHGVLSQGMICLDGEMGLLARGSGLQIFREEALLGKPLPEATTIDGALVHLKVYPNRPDCMGIIGIAREVAAMLNIQMVLPQIPEPPAKTSAAIPVEILAPMLCTRYTCRVIRGVKVGKSSPWLASRLQATGSRSINNVVDVTNFVMKEWGQPLHAFDLEQVRERIVVRRFHMGESLNILDGRTITGSKEDSPLAICDEYSPLALAGIMGGAASGISDSTVDVLLEAAHFEPTNIRLSSRRLGVSTDSSYRFERGLDPNETLDAARNRATALMFSEAGAKAVGPVTDEYPVPLKRTVFPLSAERVSGYLGIPVTEKTMTESLNKLGYECSGTEIGVPTRRVDVNDPVVLIEDVARVIGYDAILPTPSAEIPASGALSKLDRTRKIARDFLVANGFSELRGVPLEPLNPTAQFTQLKGEPVTLTNPLNADLAQSRRSLIPFALNTAELNAKRRASSYRSFEIDKVFARSGDEVNEQWSVGILLGGDMNDADWSTRRAADFFDLKGVVESLLESLGLRDVVFAPAEMEGFAEGASVIVNGDTAGYIGQIAPVLVAPRKIQTELFAAEIMIGQLVSNAGSIRAYEPLPRFPGVFRDLSFMVRKDASYEAIERSIRASAGANVETIQCIDVFEGKGIAKGSRSIAVSMAFRATGRTLSSEEVAASIERVIAKLNAEFGAELRAT